MGKKLGWLWSSFGNIVTIAGWIFTSALLAWATKVTGVFVQYQPLSWVVAGFVGALVGGLAILLVGFGQALSIQAKARRLMIREGDAIDPMQTIFQNKRIRISDLVNPFEQVVTKKKFINCELIGPANLIPLIGGGKFASNNFTNSDSVEIREGAIPQNAILLLDCDFESCRFYKVTLLFFRSFREGADTMITNMNWLTGPDIAKPEQQVDITDTSVAGRIKRWFAAA